MSTQAKSSAPNRIDQYIGKQIRTTATQVRYSDIATGILALISFTIAFFLIVAIIDAWVWPLSHLARLIGLMTWMVGLGSIIWLYLVPHFLKKINPEYAAKVIEESEIGFKNSLLNYFALRRNGNATHRAILNEVSRRAATDLSQVSIDSAVDKSNVIRIGFVLATLVAAAMGYIILSPKSPLPTIQRIIAPGSRVSQPSAVSIREVEPGDTHVFFGDRLEVSARIVGKHDPEDVRLVYSTFDSQTVDAVISMEYTGANGIYTSILETGAAGIQQPLHYRIEAADGRSPEFRVDVRPNPSISVNSIDITPPAYTDLLPRTIEGTGEIQAVEGSNIVLNATANLPIEVAYIVPLVAKNIGAEVSDYRELRSISMKSESNQATGGFTAVLNSKRDRPLFTHYKIKFSSKDGFQNTRPNIYPVRVVADLAPEVEIIQPKQKEIAIPVNQPFVVEAWAADLDYQISSLDLHIDHQGTKILDRNLHLNTDGQDLDERVQARLTITPKSLSLKPGDRAIMYATASDNRISPSSKLPDPNISRTVNYTIIIADAIDEPEQVDESEGADRDNEDAEQKQQPDETSADEADQENDQSDDSESGDDKQDLDGSDSENEKQKSAESGDQDSDSKNDNGGSDPNERAQDSDDQSSNQRSEQNSDDTSETSSDESSDGQKNDARRNDQDREGNSADQSENGSSNQQRNGGQDGKQTATDRNQESDGTTKGDGGKAKQSESRPGSKNASSESNQQNPSTDENGNRDENLQQGNSSPIREDASQGEQFEKLLEYFDKDNQEKSETGGANGSPDDENSSRSDENNSQSQTSGMDKGQQNDSNNASDAKNQQSEKPLHDSKAKQRSKAQEPDSDDEGLRNANNNSKQERDPNKTNKRGNGQGDGVAASDLGVIKNFDLYDLLVDPTYETDSAIRLLEKLATEETFDEK